MNKSSFGSHFTVTTWGESHGKALGAVIDGLSCGAFSLRRRYPEISGQTQTRTEPLYDCA